MPSLSYFLQRCDFYCTGWFTQRLRTQGYRHESRTMAELRGYCVQENLAYFGKISGMFIVFKFSFQWIGNSTIKDVFFYLQKTSWIASLKIAYLSYYPQLHGTVLSFCFILFCFLWSENVHIFWLKEQERGNSDVKMKDKARTLWNNGRKCSVLLLISPKHFHS